MDIDKKEKEYSIEEIKQEIKRKEVEEITSNITLKCSNCDLSDVCQFYEEGRNKCKFNTNDIEVIVKSLLSLMVEQVFRDLLRKKKKGKDASATALRNIRSVMVTIKELFEMQHKKDPMVIIKGKSAIKEIFGIDPKEVE